ncbi:unnamed protein product [Thelazia callipaeda]|uniref:protein-ribulosamine 3-kinase n=1 Tax=Thelazia callipaeda TaxID=103827 RepID=A0A0N5CKM0_THECL|nr:unnamed protein product [Thelazia callipaeda]
MDSEHNPRKRYRYQRWPSQTDDADFGISQMSGLLRNPEMDLDENLREIFRIRQESLAESLASHFWALVIIGAKCCGEIFASFWLGYSLLSIFLRKQIPTLVFNYIVMPVFAYLLNQKTPMTELNMADRRWLVLAYSFWVGASTHFMLINWDPGACSPPPMFSPSLVALLFEFIGPVVAHDRPLLLLSTVGVASCVCFTYAYIYACFTFTYFYMSIIAIASSFYSMQQHLADPELGYGDLSEGHVLLPIQSMYNQLVMTILFGQYIWNRNPKTAKPDTLEERYTLLSMQSSQVLQLLQRELNVDEIHDLYPQLTGGCINKAKAFRTDKYGDIFIKYNDNEKAQEMFDGELLSLKSIIETQTIRAPKPIKTFSIGDDRCLAMEFIEMHAGSDFEQLGMNIARLHLHNKLLMEKSQKNQSLIGFTDQQSRATDKFGFDIITYSGYCPLINEWSDNWVKNADRELLDLWPQLVRKIPEYFKNCKIYPCLLHGDLWSGNCSFTKDGPVIFDPASFYGHHEYEFGILTMFGGFDESFFTAYYKVIPKSNGMESRVLLYQLFHYLNHWYVEILFKQNLIKSMKPQKNATRISH